MTAEFECSCCGSEDVFDKTLPEWPCTMCAKPQALFDSACAECQRMLFGEALAELFGIKPDYNPMEDYGAPEFRVFRGEFTYAHEPNLFTSRIGLRE